MLPFRPASHCSGGSTWLFPQNWSELQSTGQFAGVSGPLQLPSPQNWLVVQEPQVQVPAWQVSIPVYPPLVQDWVEGISHCSGGDWIVPSPQEEPWKVWFVQVVVQVVHWLPYGGVQVLLLLGSE